MSPSRLLGYQLPGDSGTDTLARYLWNWALGVALQPALHTLEIALRNEISRSAAKILATRVYRTSTIPSWLDATPSMLLPHEHAKVEKAKERLGLDPRAHTEGHLIAKLDFGFWVALCRRAYDDSRGAGPRLWPAILRDQHGFKTRPVTVSTRENVYGPLDEIREFRNRVAHHEPIWDRQYLVQYQKVIDCIGWMSPKLATATEALSPAVTTFKSGAARFRPVAELVYGGGATNPLELFVEHCAWSMPDSQRQLIGTLAIALQTAGPSADAAQVARTWVAGLPAPAESSETTDTA
jgi:hypothetical protein